MLSLIRVRLSEKSGTPTDRIGAFQRSGSFSGDTVTRRNISLPAEAELQTFAFGSVLLFSVVRGGVLAPEIVGGMRVDDLAPIQVSRSSAMTRTSAVAMLVATGML